MAEADAGTAPVEAAELTIEAVQERHPEWRISPGGNITLGWHWAATPWAELPKAPVFEHHQMRRGLATMVCHADPAVLDRLISEQDRLRREMLAAGERPFDGRTYLEVAATSPGEQR